MKKNDILVAANAKVAEYMAQGYILSFGDSSFGCKFRVDLEKGNEFIRVSVKDFYDVREEGLELRVDVIDNADAFPTKGRKPVFVKNYYSATWRTNDDWYFETAEEQDAAAKVRYARYRSNIHETSEFLVGKNFLKMFKAHKGCSKANPRNTYIVRKPYGYDVEIRDKDGRTVRVERYNLKR